MEMRLLTLLIFVWLNACNKPSQDVGKKSDVETELIPAKLFSELYVNAKAEIPGSRAIKKVSEYLLAKGMDLDSLYVYEIIYSISCEISEVTSFTSDPIDACIAIFNIEHKVNHDYYLKIEVENARISKNYEKKKGGSESLVIPSKPDFLRKEILLYYYFEGDSLIDVLSQ